MLVDTHPTKSAQVLPSNGQINKADRTMIFDRERNMGILSPIWLRYMHIIYYVCCVVLCVCVYKIGKKRTVYCISNSTFDTIGRTIINVVTCTVVCLYDRSMIQ